MYPKDDNQYEEVTIVKVKGDSTHGWDIERSDGWSFWIKSDSPVVPIVGMKARFYGRGIGSMVRGLFLEGWRVYYRTEEEEKVHRAGEMYGSDAQDWLSRWDAGKLVWSLEMGGFGPGYEQCIQITAAEILRHLLERKYDAAKWDDKEAWQADRKLIDAAGFENKRITTLGLSGMQWGAALNLAARLYRVGPQSVLTDAAVEDRKIQVSRTFPGTVPVDC